MSNPLHPTLAAFLAHPDRPDDTLSYHETQGFLFAVACGPEPVLPSEWMPFVFTDAGVVHADLDDANAVMQDVMALHNAVSAQVLERACTVPADLEVREPALANLVDEAPLSQWARGFLDGHEWLAESWDYIPEEFEEEFDACFMTLSFFASRDETMDFFASGEHGDLETVAPNVVSLLPQAMDSYAQIGRALGKALEEYGEPVQEPVRVNKVGRNEPCPCGSGKKFKKCCGAS